MGPFVLKVADYSALRSTKKLITFWALNFLQTLSLKQGGEEEVQMFKISPKLLAKTIWKYRTDAQRHLGMNILRTHNCKFSSLFNCAKKKDLLINKMQTVFQKEKMRRKVLRS